MSRRSDDGFKFINENPEKFAGLVVWARVRGHVPWPGMVMSKDNCLNDPTFPARFRKNLESDNKPGKVIIKYFLVDSCDIKLVQPFRRSFSENSSMRNAKSKRDAIKMAEDFIKKFGSAKMNKLEDLAFPESLEVPTKKSKKRERSSLPHLKKSPQKSRPPSKASRNSSALGEADDYNQPTTPHSTRSRSRSIPPILFTTTKKTPAPKKRCSKDAETSMEIEEDPKEIEQEAQNAIKKERIEKLRKIRDDLQQELKNSEDENNEILSNLKDLEDAADRNEHRILEEFNQTEVINEDVEYAYGDKVIFLGEVGDDKLMLALLSSEKMHRTRPLLLVKDRHKLSMSIQMNMEIGVDENNVLDRIKITPTIVFCRHNTEDETQQMLDRMLQRAQNESWPRRTIALLTKMPLESYEPLLMKLKGHFDVILVGSVNNYSPRYYLEDKPCVLLSACENYSERAKFCQLLDWICVRNISREEVLFAPLVSRLVSSQAVMNLKSLSESCSILRPNLSNADMLKLLDSNENFLFWPTIFKGLFCDRGLVEHNLKKVVHDLMSVSVTAMQKRLPRDTHDAAVANVKPLIIGDSETVLNYTNILDKLTQRLNDGQQKIFTA